MPSLRALECLVAVADTGSITHAAALLHSSQPAVSHQIATLEREARTILLRRESRGVKLTPAGRAAVADARRAVDASASAMRAARTVGEAAGGTLRLACAQSLTVPVLAPVIRMWHRRHTDVAITLREVSVIDEVLDLLDSDQVDMAFAPVGAPARFITTEVGDEEIVLAAPTDHPLAQQQTLRIGDLDGVRMVHFAPENGLSRWLDESLTKVGVRPEAVMRTAVSTAAPQLAAAGLGIAVCPISAVSAGFPGVIRGFSPKWSRRLEAVTPTVPDPLAARFVTDVRARGVRVPSDVRAQLERDSPANHRKPRQRKR